MGFAECLRGQSGVIFIRIFIEVSEQAVRYKFIFIYTIKISIVGDGVPDIPRFNE